MSKLEKKAIETIINCTNEVGMSLTNIKNEVRNIQTDFNNEKITKHEMMSKLNKVIESIDKVHTKNNESSSWLNAILENK